MVTFTARRSKAELVVPARATPREVKSLSDVDNQPSLRLYMTVIEFFGCRVPGGAPEQPARSLKAALAEALVHYYPMAGRLRELPGPKKLVVDCTAEGAVFVEAHANVRLKEFEKPLVPPYPCVEELMCDVGDITDIIGKPLIYLQMTQLTCGGLVLAFTHCHSVVDGFGMVQLLRCIVDLARGQALPTVLPLWERHLLTTSVVDPAAMGKMTPPTSTSPPPPDQMVTRSFLFGSKEITAMRSQVGGRLATVFELITATVWRCRVAALEYAPHKTVRLLFSSNARGSWKRDPPIPPGYYGNAMFLAAAEATAGELTLARAVELVREAKLKVTDGYAASVLYVMARGEDLVEEDALDGTFAVSDMSRCGDDSLDLGSWAERVAGGSTGAGGIYAMLSSIYMKYKDTNNGNEYVVVPMCLPELVMGRFMSQIAAVTNVFARSSM